MTDWIENKLLPLVMAFAIGCIAGMDATERQYAEARPVAVTYALDCDDGSAQPVPLAPIEGEQPMYVRAR
jgi:hypothetical protein